MLDLILDSLIYIGFYQKPYEKPRQLNEVIKEGSRYCVKGLVEVNLMGSIFTWGTISQGKTSRGFSMYDRWYHEEDEVHGFFVNASKKRIPVTMEVTPVENSLMVHRAEYSIANSKFSI